MDVAMVLDTERVSDTWVAYEHLAQFEEGKPPQTIYVNACRITDVFNMTEGRRNSEWLRIFRNGGSIMIRIMFQSTSKIETQRFALNYIRELSSMPRCNLHGVNIKGLPRLVRCSNGVLYESQKVAADALALQPAAISRHLQGSLKHVGGYTFAYE